jgi:hypothetical protein
MNRQFVTFARNILPRIDEENIENITDRHKGTLLMIAWNWEFIPLLIDGVVFPNPSTRVSKERINMISELDPEKDVWHYDFSRDALRIKRTLWFDQILRRDFNIVFDQYLRNHLNIENLIEQAGLNYY